MVNAFEALRSGRVTAVPGVHRRLLDICLPLNGTPGAAVVPKQRKARREYAGEGGHAVWVRCWWRSSSRVTVRKEWRRRICWEARKQVTPRISWSLAPASRASKRRWA